MALTNSTKGDEPANDVATDKAEKTVQEPTRTRTSQRKAATAAVNAMKEQALGARKAENEDDEGKPKRGGRGRPKAISEKSSAKNERKRGASTDEDGDDEPPKVVKKAAAAAPPGKQRSRQTVRKSTGGAPIVLRRAGRPGKAAKEEAAKESEDESKEDVKAQDKADESNSEENASKTE